MPQPCPAPSASPCGASAEGTWSGASSDGRDRKHGRDVSAARLYEGEEQQDEREQVLGVRILVVDREPVAMIGNGDKGIVRLIRRARDPDQGLDCPFRPEISFWSRR